MRKRDFLIGQRLTCIDRIWSIWWWNESPQSLLPQSMFISPRRNKHKTYQKFWDKTFNFSSRIFGVFWKFVKYRNRTEILRKNSVYVKMNAIIVLKITLKISFSSVTFKVVFFFIKILILFGIQIRNSYSYPYFGYEYKFRVSYINYRLNLITKRPTWSFRTKKTQINTYYVFNERNTYICFRNTKRH